MDAPESNAITTKALEKIIKQYPKAKMFVLDRNCCYMPSAKKRPLLKQLTTYTCDKWHGFGHCATCPCNPWVHEELWKKLSGINSSVQEQVFAWFRNYAKCFNTMDPQTHRLNVLYT
eukprot:11932170-Karenia_brevis.AAC.1